MKQTPLIATAVFGAAAMVSLGALALASDAPLLFPSLGPTAFVIAHQPEAPTSCPRNTVVGHALGVASAVLALAATGLLGVGPGDGGAARVVAAALALSLTSAAMLGTRRVHPPACATTLIVALGFAHDPTSWAAILVAVTLLTALGWAAHRLLGRPYVRWAPA